MTNLLPRLFFLCLLSLFASSCNQKEEPADISSFVEKELEEEVNPASNHVVFTITTDEKYRLGGFNLLDYSNFFGSSPSELPAGLFNKASDSVQFVLKNLRQPQIMEIFNIAETVNNTRFLVTPGDTVRLNLKNGEFIFSGKNAAHYNFYANLSTTDYAENPYRRDLQQYKTATKEIYNSRKAYFDHYVKENPEVSEAFKEQVAAELKFEYLYNLVAPRTEGATTAQGMYSNNMDGISAVLNDWRNNQEQLLDLQAYFDGVTIEDFQQPELVNNDYFKRDLVDFIKHYFAQNEIPGYTEENLRRELKFINDNLQGELKTVATGKLIREYHRKGFANGREDRKFFKKVIDEYKDQPLKASYVEEISIIEGEMALMDNSLPETMMQDKLINLQGDTLTVAEVLDRTDGRIRYLDFWATWCLPCITDFKASKDFKQRISSEEKVEFIYISVEKDLERWREKSGLLKEYLTSDHQYILLDVDSSKILSFLKVRGADGRISIPQYTILDEKGQIISANAPRLADSVGVNKILKEIK